MSNEVVKGIIKKSIIGKKMSIDYCCSRQEQYIEAAKQRSKEIKVIEKETNIIENHRTKNEYVKEILKEEIKENKEKVELIKGDKVWNMETAAKHGDDIDLLRSEIKELEKELKTL